MNDQAAYRLAEAAAQQRLEDFSDDPQPTSLSREIALQRLLIEDATNAGARGLATQMLANLTTMAKAEERSLYKSGELLSRDAVMVLATRLVELVYEVFAHRFDGWQDAMDELAQRVPSIVHDVKNEPALLEGGTV